MKAALLLLFVATTAIAQPTPPGGGHGIFTPAGPHNLAGSKLYGNQSADPNTYCWWTAADTWVCVCGGVDALTLTGTTATFDVAVAYNTGTIADGDATPSVSGATVWTTSSNTGATAISDLDNPVVGATYILIGGSNTNSSTIADAGNFNLDSNFGAMTLTVDAWIVLYVQADNDYIEVGRGDNTNLDAITVPGTNGLTVGSSVPFTDNPAGTLTMTNVDAVDSTTETTIEAAIDTCANLTSIQSQTVSLSGALTVEAGGCTCNQDVTSDASPSWNAATLGSATADAGAFTMIKGAQVGDPQLQVSLSADGVGTATFATSGGSNGDMQLTPSGGDVHVTGSLDASATVQGEQVTSTDDCTCTDQLSAGRLLLTAGPADLADYDLENPDSVLFDAPATDAAATNFSVSSQGPFEGVNAAQTAGGNICQIPKTGAVNFTGVTQAGTALDTITFTGVTEACATYSVTLTEGTDYACAAAASDAECVCNIKAAIDAHATLGPLTTTYRTDATCSDEKLAVFANPALTLVVTPSDTTNTVRVEGTAGSLVVPTGLAGSPSIRFLGAGGVYGSGNGVALTSSTGFLGYVNTSQFYLTVKTLLTSPLSYGWLDRSQMFSDADGEWRMNKTTRTGSITLSVTGTVKGQTLTMTSAAANCTFAGGGGGATCVTSAFIPLGASVIAVSGRQVTAGTTCTTCTAGADMGGGLDADQYGAALECDVNDTLYTQATATANTMGTCYLAGGCTITMTAGGGNCVDGVAAWTVHYLAATAATSD